MSLFIIHIRFFILLISVIDVYIYKSSFAYGICFWNNKRKYLTRMEANWASAKSKSCLFIHFFFFLHLIKLSIFHSYEKIKEESEKIFIFYFISCCSLNKVIFHENFETLWYPFMSTSYTFNFGKWKKVSLNIAKHNFKKVNSFCNSTKSLFLW